MGWRVMMYLNLFVALLCQLFVCILTDEVLDSGGCGFMKEKGDVNQDALRKIQGLIGKSFTTTDANLPHLVPDEVFSYDVGICSTPDKEDPMLATAGALQYIQGSDEPPTVLGDIEETEIMAGKDWVSLEYEGGRKYNHHCGNESRRTLIMMVCTPGESEGQFKIIEENQNKKSDCFYLFELSHQAVCDSTSSGLSNGSIVVIVFVTLVAVYLIGGSLYQRFVVGAKGVEQFPNYHFWQDFGNLQADGCDLICRCGRRPASNTYRGIGDDQLNSAPEDDEEYAINRDDDLLPM